LLGLLLLPRLFEKSFLFFLQKLAPDLFFVFGLLSLLVSLELLAVTAGQE